MLVCGTCDLYYVGLGWVVCCIYGQCRFALRFHLFAELRNEL
jgi:hypothetical protein